VGAIDKLYATALLLYGDMLWEKSLKSYTDKDWGSEE
jgi:hypothetical protein